MPTDGSVTHWLRRLQAGDTAAAQPVWERYYGQLVELAFRRLRGAPRRAADEEDVVLSAFDSFVRGVRQGRFPSLDDRRSLWALLVCITARKALLCRRRERAAKRGAGRVQAASELADAQDDGDVLDEIVGREPSAEFAAQLAEEYRRLLDLLHDPNLRLIVVRKMEGASNAEVAQQLGCAPRTVERKLAVIHRLWTLEGEA
jgi:DNA-directed RNA polymerase specialized sigma24 family protein